MHIPQRYRDRYDRLARSHPWMREMRDEWKAKAETIGDSIAQSSVTQDGESLSELSGKLSDSREKLEADMREYFSHWMGGTSRTQAAIIGWLDRQAAITEREHSGLTISDDESLINWRGKNYLLQSRVLNAERERNEFSLKDFLSRAKAIAATLGGGKLTAEQVRKTVEKHWHDLPADYDMPEATALPEYSYNWQAIADELNSALGSGTCEVNGTNFWEWEWSDYTAYYEHELSCGHVINTMEPEPPNFCGECGARIRKAVKHG